MTPHGRAGQADESDLTRAIGVDLGGTNIRVAIVDNRARIVSQIQLPTRPERGPEVVTATIIDMVESLLKENSAAALTSVPYRGIGIGAPGPLDLRRGRISSMINLPGWNDVPLREHLSKKLGLVVTLDNDGNAAALGECWARRIDSANNTGSVTSDDLVMLTLGTGVGAGIIVGGRIFHGHFDNAGELGHMIVIPGGEPCPCGQRGCLERYASAEQIVHRVTQAIDAGEPCELRIERPKNDPMNASQIVAHANEGDPVCSRVWDEACRALAIACVNIQHIINPARIVFGGGLAAAGSMLTDSAAKHFSAMTWTLYRDQPAIELSRLGTNAGVIGAAGLAFEAANA